MPGLASLCDDLEAEHAALDQLVAPLDEEQWGIVTPAEGWTIRDQVAHLALADARAALALADPDAFARQRDADLADRAAFAAVMAGGELGSGGAEALARWRLERGRFLDAARAADPDTRVPWYGPAMSPASKTTARIMETWAHGQDVADALGVRRVSTSRLRHVAHIGVGARRYSYVANEVEPDDTPVRVELRGPHGDTWSWGEPTATDRVSGDALDFCLVVTRRRHLGQSDLRVEGQAAMTWMCIAQAFAGPPGPTRT